MSESPSATSQHPSTQPRTARQYTLTQLLMVMGLLALVLEWHRFFTNFPLRVTSNPEAFAELWREIFAFRDFQIAAAGSFLLLAIVSRTAPTRWVRLLSLCILIFAGLFTVALAGVAISL